VCWLVSTWARQSRERDRRIYQVTLNTRRILSCGMQPRAHCRLSSVLQYFHLSRRTRPLLDPFVPVDTLQPRGHSFVLPDCCCSKLHFCGHANGPDEKWTSKDTPEKWFKSIIFSLFAISSFFSGTFHMARSPLFVWALHLLFVNCFLPIL